VENAIVRPYALSQLLVDAYPLGRAQPTLVLLSSSVKFTVLSKGSVCGVIRLVYGFRLRHGRTPRLIVTFVYQCYSVVLDTVLVWSTRPKGHKDY
jgi:hypothetical protein